MILIIDGNNMAHRCRHTFNLSNAGVDVSVTYGFLRVLASYMRKYKPSGILVAWDGGIPEFRRVAVPEYKANRHKDDDPEEYQDFLRQMRELTDMLPKCGILSVRHPGAEADDIMAQAARLSINEVYIITSDKDLYQCISDKVIVVKPSMNGKDDAIINGFYVQTEFGIRVDQWVDWRAIQGDSSDNIPGVYGIGEKTATALFEQFGNMSNILHKARLGEVSGKLTQRFVDAINGFGADRISKNYHAMHLGADKVGAKYAILRALEDYQEFDSKLMKRYCIQNQFLSLMDGNFFAGLYQLECPKFIEPERIPMMVKRCTI